VDRQRLKHSLQRYRWYRPLHLAYTGWRARQLGLPRWEEYLQHDRERWKALLADSAGATRRVLIATGAGGHLPSVTLESLLAVALTMRQTQVDMLLCDAALPACMMAEINWYSDVARFADLGPADRCAQCYGPAAQMLRECGLSILTLGAAVTAERRAQAAHTAATVSLQALRAFAIDGVGIGEHAMAGALRFFARAELEDTPIAERVLRRYFLAALLAHEGACALFAQGGYEAVVLNHGIYVPQGVVAETARRHGVRVITWHTAYRRGCFIFSHDETYHHSLLSESSAAWEGMRWSPDHARDIERYLRSRWEGVQDWETFQRNPELSTDAILRETGIDPTRPIVGLLTNVAWDAQLHYRGNAFPNMLDWLLKTIDYFSQRPDLQLLIRIHPAELIGKLPSRQPAQDEIGKAFPKLPANVFVIPAHSRLSTYAAMSLCNAVLIYGTKTGVELSAAGIPVIVAGEAWIRDKGITFDAHSAEHYFDLLDGLPLDGRLSPPRRERGLRYAYHFFFRRMIPMDCVEPSGGWPPFRVAVSGLDELAPGACTGLDVVCDGILHGAPFLFRAEEATQ